jgi:hypothetical protein
MTATFNCYGCNRTYRRQIGLLHRRCACGMYYDGEWKPLWETKNGRSIPVSNMETSHINSALAMILVTPDWRQGYAKLLIEELERRKLKAGAFQ